MQNEDNKDLFFTFSTKKQGFFLEEWLLRIGFDSYKKSKTDKKGYYLFLILDNQDKLVGYLRMNPNNYAELEKTLEMTIKKIKSNGNRNG